MADLQKWSVQLEEEIASRLAASPPPFAGDGAKPVWSIDTPPPYPSGKWHIGAVAGYSLIDVIARAKRMERSEAAPDGHDVLFPWGVDRNGINIEFAIEKKHKRRMQDWAKEFGEIEGRARFNEACEEAISQYSDDMARIGRRIGLSCDFDSGYKTDSPDYRAFSQACFLDLFQKGRIVEDLRPNSYDPKLGTSIADAEVFYEERKARLNHVTWTVKETGEQLTISTTRPELICACRQVLVHPDNEETQHLIGKTAVLPTVKDAEGNDVSLGRSGNEEVPIGADSHVQTDFGSGVMMVCSYGDQADVQLFRELDLEPIAAIGLDGRMTEAAGPYEGLKVQEAKEKITADLEAAGKLPEYDEIDQKFPISERSKAPVEIILLKEWYVKQTDAVEEMHKIAGETNFIPPKHRQLLLDWIDTVTIDWPISRRRYYHTEIPLWYVVDEEGNETDHVIVPPGDMVETQYYRPWCEDPPVNSKVMHREDRHQQEELRIFMDEHAGWSWRGEEKVFDTWMDSSVSNLYILKDHRAKDWGKEHICSVRPQGRDIVRTWLYYTILKSHLLLERPAFENVWIHGMGVDKHGRKMSKSHGNVIDPDSIIDKFGADAFRLWISGECTIGDDFRINEQKVQGAFKFLQKLQNVAKFVHRFERPSGTPESLHAVDEWILGELDRTIEKSVEGYSRIDFFTPANAIRSFVWNLFAPHYVEMVKGRAYEGDPAACWTLHHVVRTVLQLMAPICPFLTHYLTSNLYEEDVHAQLFPQCIGVERPDGLTDAIVEFNSKVWKAKKDAGISLAAPIDGIEVPDELQAMEDILASMHGLGEQEVSA